MSVAERLGLKIGSRNIKLPSNGIFGGPQEVTVRPFVTIDEKFIAGIDEYTGEKSIQNLAKNVVTNAPLNIDDLLDADILFITMIAKCLTYSDIVQTQYLCGQCGTANDKTVNLFDFETKLLQDRSFTTILPKSGLEITYEILTIGKKNKIETEMNQKYQLMNKTVDLSELEVRQLASAITGIKKDGEEVEVTLDEKFEVINTLLTKADMEKWADDMMEQDVNPVFDYEDICSNCGTLNKNRLAMTIDFFFTGISKVQSLPLEDF